MARRVCGRLRKIWGNWVGIFWSVGVPDLIPVGCVGSVGGPWRQHGLQGGGRLQEIRGNWVGKLWSVGVPDFRWVSQTSVEIAGMWVSQAYLWVSQAGQP